MKTTCVVVAGTLTGSYMAIGVLLFTVLGVPPELCVVWPLPMALAILVMLKGRG